jgi:hypothetical protein
MSNINPMERASTLITLTMLALATHAQLHHRTPAPTETHMREVNAQWVAQGQVPEKALDVVSFQSEAERIAQHLQLVRHTLSQRMPEGLSAAQLNERNTLLEQLDSYAQRGLFPQNHVLPHRNPVFIDPYGTACAVGQLMIESGHEALAQRIASEMNTAYVLDMDWPEIGAWAEEHGFTPQELAWIQPGYPPNLPWATLGGGTNGPVTVLEELSNGNLLVAGNFSEAGGSPSSQVVIWNGTSFTSLGNSFPGEITCAVEHEGFIYVGGAGILGAGDLARWNGSSWTYHTIMEGKWPQITALHVHNGDVYAAGSVLGFAGADHVVRRLNEDLSYVQVGSPLNGTIHALATHMGFLVAGGEFTGLVGNTDPVVAHLALLEGNEWAQLANGTDATVRTLLTNSDDLYIGGDLLANIAVTFGLAKLSGMNPEVDLLLPNHGDYIDAGLGAAYINNMVMRNEALYFTGRFTVNGFMTFGNTVARYHGTPDDLQPMMYVQEPGTAIALFQDRLVVGGEFTEYAHLAALDLNTSVQERSPSQVHVSPNPATENVVLRFATDAVPQAVEVLDAAGRITSAPVVVRQGSVHVDVRSLSTGSYTVRAVVNGTITTARFIRE